MKWHIRESEWFVTGFWLVLLLIPFIVAGIFFVYGHWLWGLLALGVFPVWGFFVALPVVNLLFRPKGRQHPFRWH